MTIEKLRQARPDVAITIGREIDDDAVWEFDDPQPDDARAYVWEVTAYTIKDGKIYSGTSYLGCSWYNDPAHAKVDSDIHGYLPQMINEAVDKMDQFVREGHPDNA